MRSKGMKRGIAVLGAIAMLGLGTSLANAVILSSSLTLTGVEIAATSSQGTFVGTAVDQSAAGLSGTWYAVVDHSSLTPCTVVGHPCASVTGGTFTLYTAINQQPATITGSFVATGYPTTNSITPAQLSSGFCGNEQFLITDTLGGVGINGTGQGTGSFTVILTHYRILIFGYCLTYAATVVGNATLTLP